MTDNSNNSGKKPTDDFNALYLERKLVELIEEVRLRRNIEVESEKTLKSVMDEKYQEELSWDEQMRRHSREKENLEQQIELLKRKLEDKVCVSDEDKAKQQVMNKTYSHEIRQLKEELRVSKSEKLNLQKKNQELEGKLKLHDNFQDSILNEISEARRMMKESFEESKELMDAQRRVMENVASAKFMFKKYDLCNQHLLQCIQVIGKKSDGLKKELVDCRTENTILKQSMPTTSKKSDNHLEVEKLQNKILDLENVLLTSRKENEKTLNNFLESNKLLTKFIDKLSEIQEREKKLAAELELFQEKLHVSEKELQKAKDRLKETEENVALKEKKRVQNQCSAETQTEDRNQCCACSKKSFDDPVAATLAPSVPDAMEENFMDDFKSGLMNLEQNALVMKSGIDFNNGIRSFSLDQLCVNAGGKKVTLSQVLKRKLEIMESGNEIERISMKKRYTENSSQSIVVVDHEIEGDSKNKMLLTREGSDLPLCNNSNSVAPVTENEMLNSDISVSLCPSPVIKTIVVSNNLSGEWMDHKGIQEGACPSSSIETETLIPHSDDPCQPLPDGLNQSVALLPPSVDILLDHKYLTYKKFSGMVDTGDDNKDD